MTEFLGISLSEIGYGITFGLMTLNGFFSFPSSQLLYIGLGYLIGLEKLSFYAVLIAGALGNTLGNLLLFGGTRKHGLAWAEKFLLVPKETLIKMKIFFEEKDWPIFFLGKITPGVKVFAPVAAGLSLISFSAAAIIFLFGSLIWAVPFISIGLFFGLDKEIIGNYLKVIGLIALVIGLVGFFYFEKRKENKEKGQAKNN